MSNKLFVLIGPSNAGKDCILKGLIEEDFLSSNNIHKVVRHTSRFKRKNETHGVDYYFVSEKEMQDLYQRDQFAEFFTYPATNGKETVNVSYGTIFSSIDLEHHNYICQGAIEVYECLKGVYGDNCIPIYIDVEDKIRLTRAINRSENENCLEICRRFITDNEKYSDENRERLGITSDFIIHNNDYIGVTISNVISLIKKYID